MSTAVQLAPAPVFKAFDNNGNPLFNGLLYTYVAGSSTPQATYVDYTGTTPNTNPVVLNARGEANVWLAQGLTYKLTLTDALGNQIWSVDQIQGGNLLTQAAIGALLYPQTTAEMAASVTPTYYNYPELDPRRYGADTTGTTNTETAISALISVASQYTSGVTIQFPQSGRYRLDTGFPTFNANIIRLNFNGSTLDFSHMTAGYAFQPFNSKGVNIRPLVNISHPITNAYCIGPGVGVTAVTACYLADTASSAMFGIHFENMGFQDFATDVYFGQGASFCTFRSCHFTLLSGAQTTYSIIQSNTAGERNQFIDCSITNKPYGVQNLATSSADLNFFGCSIDYFTTAISNSGGAGRVKFIGGHIESNTDTANWVYNYGGSSSCTFVGTDFVVTGNKTAFDICYSDATVTNGSLTLIACELDLGGSTMSKYLIGGTGQAKVSGLIQQNGAVHPPIASALNLLAYGGFESANYTAEWTFSGATAPSRSNAQAHTGTYSLLFPGVAADIPNAYNLVPCSPGQYYQGEYWYLAPAISGTGATFIGEVDYLDKGGNSLGNVLITQVTTNVTAWTRANFRFQTPAPIGTVNARLLFQINSDTTGAAAYVDDVVINVV